MRVRISLGALLVFCVVGPLQAQGPLFTDAFPPEEFSDRRAEVLDKIGDAVAVMQGATEFPGYIKFRQNAQFFYLTGVEVPRAILLLDGRTGGSTLYLPARNERAEGSEGPILVPGDDATRLTGIDAVVDRELVGADLERVIGEGRALYTRPLRVIATATRRRPPQTLGMAASHVRLPSSRGSARSHRPSRSWIWIRFSMA
jgi:hypothetical protein